METYVSNVFYLNTQTKYIRLLLNKFNVFFVIFNKTIKKKKK